MRLTADREVCTGAGNCVRLAPDWFEQDDEEGLVVSLVHDVPAELADLARDVVYACPTGAIRMEDA